MRESLIPVMKGSPLIFINFSNRPLRKVAETAGSACPGPFGIGVRMVGWSHAPRRPPLPDRAAAAAGSQHHRSTARPGARHLAAHPLPGYRRPAADMCWPVKGASQIFFSSVWGAERTAFRRLISLIFAGWLPHDNRFVGELPCSKVEGHSISGCLLAATRVLPPLSVLLPTHCLSTGYLAPCCRLWQRLAYRPDESGQLPGDGDTHFHLQLPPGLQQPVTRTQPLLRLPCDLLDLL